MRNGCWRNSVINFHACRYCSGLRMSLRLTPPRPNAEGLVVHFITSDERLKLKQEWYVQQHRLLTGLTARQVGVLLRVLNEGN